MMEYGWQNQGWGAGTWIWMIVMMVLFWAFLVAGVTYIARHIRDTHSPVPHLDHAAVDALKMRFARGEINEEEFQRRLKLLRDEQ